MNKQEAHTDGASEQQQAAAGAGAAVQLEVRGICLPALCPPLASASSLIN